MSLPSSWRQFQLFDFTPIKDPNYNSKEPLYSDPSLSSIYSTNLNLVISVNNAFIKIISKEFALVKTFIAYNLDYRITFVRSLPNSDLLVTLAEKQGSPSVLKLWDLNKIIHLEDKDDESLKHKFQTQVSIHNGDNSYPISCFQFNEDFTCVAIGYTNGKVILVRGDLVRDRGSKQRVVYEANDPITGIQFNKFEDLLYITTTSKILTVLTSGRNQGKPNRILSNKTSVDLNCSDIDPKTQQLIVGTNTSLRYYNHLSKSHTINFEIPKKRIFRFNMNYLLIVSPNEELIDSTKSKKLLTKILIIDLFNKHISFNLTIPNIIINHIFKMWGDIYILTSDGVLYKLHEKPINQQIELILQRELFPVAYNLAKQSNLSNETLLRIQKLYGEFLYEKSDFDESINVFIKCLELFNKVIAENEDLDDFVMNIITKFKDASNINNLTKFLFKLYELNLANNDHITLLLCCYCKLKMTEDLDNFINDLNLDETTNLQELNFQLIINLFKECGYFKQVIKLLYKLNQPNLIVGIQLNDLHQPKQCLEFIKSLSIDELLLILIDHSKTLLDYVPIETTELLINVFTGKYVPIERLKEPFNIKENETNGANKEERDSSTSPLNSYKAFLTYISGSASSDKESDKSSTFSQSASEPTYLPPKPSLIYASFINNPNEFVIFLEACIETFDRYQGNPNDKKDLLITLLEMYLSLAQKESNYEWINKARNLISEYSPLLDKSALLLISHIYDFKEGEILSKAQSGFEESLFRTSQILGDIEGCFQVVYKYAESKPDLYKMMLKFMVSKKEIFEQIEQKDFNYILNKIKTLKLATPLEIIQILSGNELTTIGLIKDYLIEFIENQNKEISNNIKLIEFYENESTKNSHKLTELISKPFIIQNNKCSHCQLKLDFPMAHFKCKHSFHQKCLNENLIVSNSISENSRQCPLCINELDEVKSIRLEQLNSKDKIDVFESSLHESNDRFKFISEYLGKGIMENESVTLLD